MSNLPIIVLLGPPASGKSTVFKKIKDIYPEIGHFAVRLFFEKEIMLQTDWGKRAIPDEKGWLPDEVVAQAAEMHIKNLSSNGMIIEGFPASKKQAELFNSIMQQNSLKTSKVIYLKLDTDTSISRAQYRKVCLNCDNGVNHVVGNDENQCPKCLSLLTKRKDDTGDRFINRLQIHHNNIEEVIDTLKLPIFTIDGSLSKENVLKEVLKQII